MNFTKVYERYVDSGLVWVGNYPELWRLTKVKYEASVKARVGWHGLKSDDFTDDGPYLVTGTDFKGKSINWSDCYHCDIERYEQDPYIQLRNGDLLITKDGTIGKVALVENLKVNDKATLNSGVFVIRPLSRGLATKFYFWLLQSKVFKDFVDYYKTGSTILHLYQDTFVNFIYAAPSFIEQTRIAAFLNYETARIDELIAKQLRLISLLQEKRQAVISHAVTKGLNPNAPMKDSGIEWLGQVPMHWIVKPLRHLGYCQNGINIGAEAFGSGYPFVSYGDAYKNRVLPETGSGLVQSTPEDRKRYSLLAGDVLFTRTSETIEEIGFASVCLKKIENACFAGFLIRFRPNLNDLDANYSKYYFSNQLLRAFFIKEMNLITRASLSQDLLKTMPVVLPPRIEQKAIAEVLDEKSKRFDRLQQLGEEQIKILQERRTALISAAVTGKIDLRGWTPPADEVAA